MPQPPQKTTHLALLMVLALMGGPSCATAQQYRGSGSAESAQEGSRIALSDRVSIEAIAPGVWRHISLWDLPIWGLFPANGLIVATDGGALMVDTAWDDAQTDLILDWTAREVGPVHTLLITHAHNDRMGGIGATVRRDIKAFAHTLTPERARAEGWPAPTHAIADRLDLQPLGVRGELWFPGAAHAPDNTVVWLEEPGILFGGCMVRALSTAVLGATGDADFQSWADATARLQARYPSAIWVVPGHGAPGDKRLLSHTAALLADRPQ